MKNRNFKINSLITVLQKETESFGPTLVDKVINQYGCNPILILVTILLSLRSQDKRTINVCRELFKAADTAEKMLKIPVVDLEKLFFQLGFYKKKAKIIKEVLTTIVTKFNCKVPDTTKELIKYKRYWKKNYEFICVDSIR